MRSPLAKHIVQKLSSKRVRQIEIRLPYAMISAVLTSFRKCRLSSLKEVLPQPLKRSMLLAQEKGASSWIRDLTANLLSEVCSDVQIEPDLQPLTGEILNGATSNSQDGARLDIAANGFWGGRYQQTYFDVRVFNPHAMSNRQTSLAACYRKQEAIKKRAYEQRVREVEHSSFTPLVLSATGGLAAEATTFYKRLAARLADKWEQPYSKTMAWLRCRLTFSLLRSAIQCIIGARSSCGHVPISSPHLAVDLAISELQLN